MSVCEEGFDGGAAGGDERGGAAVSRAGGRALDEDVDYILDNIIE